ncbi:hypothetical protein Pcinc_015836 [Petrolisthes cinctipes]|uniref:Uncharacterized protein n=1 Tax=Petrolisthes cinctipes TaxID=88211 RepID=A0AAE1FUV2_PETCI|nr:hypothetical protein Pcinc_015836 [Petrolisthes cinctipes]
MVVGSHLRPPPAPLAAMLVREDECTDWSPRLLPHLSPLLPHCFLGDSLHPTFVSPAATQVCPVPAFIPNLSPLHPKAALPSYQTHHVIPTSISCTDTTSLSPPAQPHPYIFGNTSDSPSKL